MMILKEHNISVRLPQERAIDTGIVFVQNDKDVYKLNIRVFDGVYEIDYTEVEEATITFSKADGKVVQGDMQIEADQLTYVLGTNEIAAPGKLLASIQLLGANERLTTARFLFRVEKDLITEDAVKSTSEFAILQRLKEELEAIDVVDLTNQFNAHKAANVYQQETHGLYIEEGFWTPKLQGASGSSNHTYARQTGKYFRMGNIVHANFWIVITEKDPNMMGLISIAGLPFPANLNYRQGVSFAYVSGITINGQLFGNTYGDGIQLVDVSTVIESDRVGQSVDIRGSVIYFIA